MELINLKKSMPSPEFQKFYQTLRSRTLPIDMTIGEIRAYFSKMMEPFAASKDIEFTPIFFSKFQGVWVKPPKIKTKSWLLVMQELVINA
jgi:hypothetical protein